MASNLKKDITDLEQKSGHLSALLDALWHLVTADNRLHEHEIAVLLECQLRARQIAQAVQEATGPLNIRRAA